MGFPLVRHTKTSWCASWCTLAPTISIGSASPSLLRTVAPVGSATPSFFIDCDGLTTGAFASSSPHCSWRFPSRRFRGMDACFPLTTSSFFSWSSSHCHGCSDRSLLMDARTHPVLGSTALLDAGLFRSDAGESTLTSCTCVTHYGLI